MVAPARLLVQESSRIGKLSCMLSFSVRRCRTCGFFIKQLLTSAGKVQLPTESIVKIDAPSFLSKEGKCCFLVVVVIERER